MHHVVDTIRKIAREQAAQQLAPALGLVTSIHTRDDYSCTVKLRETGLVLPKVPIASGLIGWVAAPHENDLVVVVFLGGDIHAPVIVGRLYNEQVAPPDLAPGQAIASLPNAEAADDKALRLTVDTPGDSRRLTLTLGGSVKVELEIDDSGLRLQAQDAVLTLSQTGSSDGKAELKVGGSQVTIEQSGDLTVSAQGTLKLKATQIEISADAQVKIAGQVVNLN